MGAIRSSSADPAGASGPYACVVRRRRAPGPRVGGPVRWWWLGAALAASLAWAAPAEADRGERRQTSPRAVAPAAAGGDFARRIQIRGGRKLYLECRGSGSPTVVLEAGNGDRADIWSVDEVQPGSGRTMVLPGVARFTRVCAYDRPGTVEPGPSRSDPAPTPRTARDMVADLHALLRAARVPGPYVLVGHSFGGLVVRLYASSYPRRVVGMVLVDAAHEDIYEAFEALLGPRRSPLPTPSKSTRTPPPTRCAGRARPGRCARCRYSSSRTPPTTRSNSRDFRSTR
jgi:pimeloyl-ACP methyl ester carboxylesterase